MVVSPRNSEAAIVDLLKKTESTILITDIKYKPLAESFAAQVLGVKSITQDPLDTETLLQESLNPNHVNILNYDFSDEDIEKIPLIAHTSGSAAFPKPISISNRCLFHVGPSLQQVAKENGSNTKIDPNDTFLA